MAEATRKGMIANLQRDLKNARSEIERLRVALIEIEHHSTDKNAAATARAALAIADEQTPPGEK